MTLVSVVSASELLFHMPNGVFFIVLSILSILYNKLFVQKFGILIFISLSGFTIYLLMLSLTVSFVEFVEMWKKCNLFYNIKYLWSENKPSWPAFRIFFN